MKKITLTTLIASLLLLSACASEDDKKTNSKDVVVQQSTIDPQSEYNKLSDRTETSIIYYNQSNQMEVGSTSAERRQYSGNAFIKLCRRYGTTGATTSYTYRCFNPISSRFEAMNAFNAMTEAVRFWRDTSKSTSISNTSYTMAEKVSADGTIICQHYLAKPMQYPYTCLQQR